MEKLLLLPGIRNPGTVVQGRENVKLPLIGKNLQ